MDPSDRNLVLAALDPAATSPDTVSGLVKYLVDDGIFTKAAVNQHLREIIGIWRDWRQRSALSPPDSNIGGRQDEPDSNSPTGKLALYGPVDDQVKLDSITLFRPHHGNFGFAHSRRSERAVSFIREETIKVHKLEPEVDGTVVIQWRYAGRVADDFQDRDDDRVRHTCCVVLSAEDVKEVGMTVDVVFGTSCVADLDQQRSDIPPPPRCPTPPDAPRSDIDQLDGPATSSFGYADGAAQQMVPTVHPGSYPPLRPSHAEPSPLVINADHVYVFNNTLDPFAFAQQIGSSIGNRAATSARTAASSMSEAPAIGGGSKRKADGDTQGFDRVKRFHG